MVATLAAAFSFGHFAHAQDDDVFELSPFTVDASEDTGYRATSTLTGSRLNTSLRDTAASVSVFTQEFLDDTGLTDLEEIAKYSVGSKNNTQDINSGGNINNYLGAANPIQRIRLRGVRGTKGLNYFQAFIPDDGYRAGRYDESRGPNGILFGISDAGGVVNTATLNANTQEDSGRIKYTTGSYSRNRLEARVNKVLMEDVLGITVAGVTQDNGNNRTYQIDQRDRVYGALAWKPTDRLTIQANAETGHHFGTRIRPFLAADRFLAWHMNRENFGVDAVTFNVGRESSYGDETDAFVFDGRDPQEDSSSNSDRSQFDLRSLGLETYTSRNNERYVYNANNSSFYNIGGTWRTDSFSDGQVASLEDTQNAGSVQDVLDADGSGIGTKDTARILGYEQYGFAYPTSLNAAGPDMYRTEEFDTYTFMADYKLTENLYFNFAHNHQNTNVAGQFVSGSEPEIRGDPNRLLRHPQVDDVDPLAVNPFAGQLYFDANWRYQEHNIDYDESRAALSWDLDFSENSLDALGRHRVALGWSKREVSDRLLGNRYGFLGNPYDGGPTKTDFDDSRNRIAIRTYLTEGDFDTYRIDGPPLGTTTIVDDEGVERQIGYMHENAGTGNARSDIDVTSYIFALQDYFFDEKLVTTFGFRQDEAKNTAFGHVLDPLYGETVSADPEAKGYRIDDPIKADTKTAGVVYHLNDNLSLIANYATSIGLPEFRNVVFPDRGIAAPVEGEGKDYGIAFSGLDNRLSGRFVYFETEAKNRTGSGGGTRIISDPMRDSMRALDEIREYDSSFVRKDDGNPYSDAEWAEEVNHLNGASGEGLSPSGRVNAFLQDNNATGYELSLTANITENWRLTVNGSYTDRLMANYGHGVAVAAGYLKDADGRFIQGVTVDAGEDEALAVDPSLLADGSIHQRILEIAGNVVGTIPLFDDGDPAGTRDITAGSGAILINTDDSFEESLNEDESIAYRLWESQDQLQINIDEREKRWGLNPYKFNMFTAYDFKEGALKGFTVGGGYRWLDGAIIGEDADGNELTNSAQGHFDLMMKYSQKLNNGHKIDYQINVYNMLDNDDINPVRYSVLNDSTSPLSRFDLPEPRTARASITYSF